MKEGQEEARELSAKNYGCDERVVGDAQSDRGIELVNAWCGGHSLGGRVVCVRT